MRLPLALRQLSLDDPASSSLQECGCMDGVGSLQECCCHPALKFLTFDGVAGVLSRTRRGT